METLKDLYIEELKDLYSAENQLTKAIPKMAKAATNPELKKAFETHLKQTERQIERLEKVFKELDESPKGKKCKGMEGLIEEGAELIKEKPDEDVLDAGLISKAQHVEHYEIAGYGTVRTYAQLLGFDRQAELLQQTLDEEAETDKLLSELAESSVNLDAVAGESATADRSAGAKGRESEVRRTAQSDRAKSSAGTRSRSTASGRESREAR